MNQHATITPREDDYSLALFRGEQQLLKFFGQYEQLEKLAAYWGEDVTTNAAIEKAVKLRII